MEPVAPVLGGKRRRRDRWRFGGPDDYLDEHPEPSAVVLVMEVADTTLDTDRTRKSSLYASAGIPEYWISNLRRRALEVRREPDTDSAAPFGYDYRQVTIYFDDDRVSPLFAPDAPIAVRDLLPRLPDPDND